MGLEGALEVHFCGELFDLDHVFVTATALYCRLHFCTRLWLPWGSLLGIDKLCRDQEPNLFFAFFVLKIQGQGCIFFFLSLHFFGLGLLFTYPYELSWFISNLLSILLAAVIYCCVFFINVKHESYYCLLVSFFIYLIIFLSGYFACFCFHPLVD